MNGCEACTAYIIKYGQPEAGSCIMCEKGTMVWKQDPFGTFYLECSDCGGQAAVDLNTPCEQDPDLYRKIKVKLMPQEQLPDAKVIIKLGRLFQIDSVTMRKKLQDGYTAKIEYEKLLVIKDILNENGISYTTDEKGDMTEKYPLYKECNYPYSPMSVFKSARNKINN